MLDVEETLKEHNVDIETVKKNFGTQHIIPKEWYYDILRLCIDNCKIKPDNIMANKKDNIFTLQFDSPELCNNFELEFHKNVLPGVNQYLKEQQNVRPKDYSRNLILETKTENYNFTIQY